MKRFWASLVVGAAVAAWLGLGGAALAQVSATPMQPGSLETTGCPGGWVGPCFVPFTSAHPLPVSPTNSSGAPLYVVGFDSGTAPTQTATPANSSHTAGKVVGGLFTIPIARIVGGSGAVSRFFGYSVAGDTTGLLWRIWDKFPAATACTDNSNFVGSATDDLHLIAQPFSATPAAVAQTQGDAKTYFEVDFLPPASYKNQDTSPSVNIYACAVATATYTPGVGAYSADATGYQN